MSINVAIFHRRRRCGGKTDKTAAIHCAQTLKKICSKKYFSILHKLDVIFFSSNLSPHTLFDKSSILQPMQSQLNHTSYINFHLNELIANALRNNIEPKIPASNLRKNLRSFFSFKYQKIMVRINYTIKHNQAQ